ncbi:MAG: HIT family hydrolase [Nitrospiraceae bacterium]|nr:HIT family hydrolase [Nitrospiraceae bacterium]
MKQIWAPWRMNYIKSADTAPSCIFCDKPGMSRSRDKESYIFHRGQRAFVMMNIYPYANGHLLIAPYLHLPSLEDLPAIVSHDLMDLTRHSLAVLRATLAPDGFNVGMNLGHAAGAGVKSHVHLHIVPRWKGDSNFMPILAETLVVPEHLNTTYNKLLPYFRRKPFMPSPKTRKTS